MDNDYCAHDQLDLSDAEAGDLRELCTTLVRAGVEASLEFPGYIEVRIGTAGERGLLETDDDYLAIGRDAEKCGWQADIFSADGSTSTPTDVFKTNDDVVDFCKVAVAWAYPSDDPATRRELLAEASHKNIQERTVRRMKREIRDDVKQGIVPALVQAFSELHDYVDANWYGGLCEDSLWEEWHADESEGFGFEDRRSTEERWSEFCNAVQGEIHFWLKNGGHRP